MYRREDIADLKTTGSLPGEFPYVRGTRDNNHWLTRQDILAEDPAEANRQALDVLGKGVNSLGFKVKDPSKATIETLLKGIDVKAVELNFNTCPRKALDLAKALMEYLTAHNLCEAFRGSYE